MQARGRLVLLCAAFLAILLALATLSGSPAYAGDVASADVASEADEALEYWTPQRLREARPLESRQPVGSSDPGALPASKAARPSYVRGSETGNSGRLRLRSGTVGSGGDGDASASGHVPFAIRSVADTAAYPHRTHGKVFGSLPGFGDFACSATVVPGNTQSTVMTAAHCVYEQGSGFASNWVFVPGYNDGATPHGMWPADRLAAAKGFVRNDQNVNYDVGAAELAHDSSGRGVEEVVGSRGIAFNQLRDQIIHAYGYPAEPAPGLPFDGELLWTCESGYGGDDPASLGFSGPQTLLIGCPMTGGSSGGGWVVGEEGSGSGFVESVNSYGYPDEPEHLYGSYFGNEARKVWVAAQDSCRGRLATLRGTEGDDRIVGTPAADVIVAKGGADIVNGRGGNDRICGGDDADKLRGKGGKDKLDGGNGPDRLAGGRGRDGLNGGGGRDKCNGGAGRDTQKSCEKARRI